MLLERLGKELLFFDGGMGTLLQAEGLQPGELPETWNIKRKETRRDYYPSMDEISVLGRAFEKGLRACCVQMGARTSENNNVPSIRVLTDTPPSWIDI